MLSSSTASAPCCSTCSNSSQRAHFNLHQLLSRDDCATRAPAPARPSRQRDVVVLDQHAIAEVETMVGAAAAAHRVLFQHAQAGRGFAGVQDRRRSRRRRPRSGASAWRCRSVCCITFRMTRSQERITRALWHDDRDRLPFMQAHAVENFGVADDLGMRGRRCRPAWRRPRGCAERSPCRRARNPAWQGWWPMRAGSDQCRRSVVASRVARSSSNAFSRMAVILRLVQSTIDLSVK